MVKTGQIQVTLLANEGILVQFDGIKMLIDSIHVNQNETFSGLSKHVLDDLMAGEKPLFQNVDYILYTHCHYDHFSAESTEAYLEKHRVKGLFIPERSTLEFASLREMAQRQADQIWFLDLPLGEKKEIQLLENVSLTVFRSTHAGREYAEVEHFCYLLNFNSRKVFIIADSEYNACYFSDMLSGESIEVAFINPLFLNRLEGRQVINRAMKPEKLVVYHIPFEAQDQIELRKLVLQDTKKYQDSMPPIFILWNELQTMFFEGEVGWTHKL